MEKFIKKWKNLNLFSKCSYLSVCLLFIMIPFTGLILESLTKTSHTPNGTCSLKIQYFS